MTVQEMLRIALRHFTAMADAMVAACVAWCAEHDEPIELPERKRPDRRGRRPEDDPDEMEWRRMVEGNSDTRHHHV